RATPATLAGRWPLSGPRRSSALPVPRRRETETRKRKKNGPHPGEGAARKRRGGGIRFIAPSGAPLAPRGSPLRPVLVVVESADLDAGLHLHDLPVFRRAQSDQEPVGLEAAGREAVDTAPDVEAEAAVQPLTPAPDDLVAAAVQPLGPVQGRQSIVV